MSVEFPDEKFEQSNSYEVRKVPFMVKCVLKSGLVKDEKQANVVLLIVSAVFLALAFFVFASTGKSTTEPTYIEDLPTEVIGQLPPEILETIPSKYDN